MSRYTLRNETLHTFNCVGLDEPLLSDVTIDTIPRAIEEASIPAGSARHDGIEIPIHVVVYGGLINLDQPREGTFRIVSALTVERAKRYGRSTDDLLVPYGYDPVTNKALGLASLGFVKNNPPPPIINETHFSEVDTALPYPCKIFTPQTPDFVEPEHEPLTTIAPSACDVMQVMYQEKELSDELTSKIGIAVYNVSDPIISHSEEQFIDGSILVVEPKVVLAGLDLCKDGIIRGAMMGSDVRFASGPRQNGVLGGKRLIVPYRLAYKV